MISYHYCHQKLLKSKPSSFVLTRLFNQYQKEWHTILDFRTREEFANSIRKNYPEINGIDEISRTLAETVHTLKTVSPLSKTDSIDLLKILDGDNFQLLTTNLRNRLKEISKDSQEAKDIGIALGLLRRLDTITENGELIPIFKPENGSTFNGRNSKLKLM